VPRACAASYQLVPARLERPQSGSLMRRRCRRSPRAVTLMVLPMWCAAYPLPSAASHVQHSCQGDCTDSAHGGEEVLDGQVRCALMRSVVVPFVNVPCFSWRSSPYVRKTAAHAISKVFSLDPDQRSELVGVISRLLGDRSVMVRWPLMHAVQSLPLVDATRRCPGCAGARQRRPCVLPGLPGPRGPDSPALPTARDDDLRRGRVGTDHHHQRDAAVCPHAVPESRSDVDDAQPSRANSDGRHHGQRW
jgi:hypothetical protein